MDFLKTILGDDLFKQVEEKINEHNGNDANKDNQIKIGNLGGGEYVGKAKYDALQALLDGKTTELDTANGLIADLKKGTKGNEELQGKVSAYETQVAQLQAQLQETKLNNALQLAIRDAKGVDVDYLAYKIKELAGDKLSIDENEKVKGIDDYISTLKEQSPTLFESEANRKVEPHRLPEPSNNKTYTKEEILKKPYSERLEIFESDPEGFKAAMKS